MFKEYSIITTSLFDERLLALQLCELEDQVLFLIICRTLFHFRTNKFKSCAALDLSSYDRSYAKLTVEGMLFHSYVS